MLVLARTDHNIDKREGQHEQIASAVKAALGFRSEHITRVEVHVSDQNGELREGARQMRCVIEARLEHRQPVAVTHHADTVDHAVVGATGRLIRVIDHVLGRTHDLSARLIVTNHPTRDAAGHLPDATGAPGDPDFVPNQVSK